MSNIQDAIEREIADQIETRIDDAIYENTDVQQLKSDVEDLEAKVEELRDEHDQRLKEIISDTIREDIVNQALYKLTDTLVKGLYGNDEYTLIRTDRLEEMKKEIQEKGGQQ
jgi:tetrahydromethanopterin S-methyltransferase subunit G